MTIRQLLVVLLLSSLAGFSGWLLFRDRGKEQAPHFVGPPRSDYVLQDFEMASFDNQGKLTFRLHAPRLTHDDARNTFDIDNPAFHFFDSNNEAWHAEAERASINAENKQVALRNKVVAGQKNKNAAASWNLTTEELDADTTTRIISSKVAVTLLKPGAVLQSIGLQANLDNREFLLSANVRGRFEVPHD